MAEASLTVVIPTKDRCALLRETLGRLARQERAPTFEVVVADDGSSDETPAFLSGAAARFPFPIQSVRLSGNGPAAARNRAIALAAGPRVLLLGDDTFPAPDALAQHETAAAGREVGVQGRIDWDPESPVTPVMRFLAPEGAQFYFRGLEPGRPIPYTALYASNVSAPTRWFREEPFDEGFPAAAFEDTELGYRWRRLGREVIYWDRAICHHRHHYDSLEPFLARQRLAGRAARYAARLHPGMVEKTVLRPLAVGLVFAIRYAWRRRRGNARPEEEWDLRVRKAFLEGILGRTPAPASGRNEESIRGARRP